MKNRHQHRVGSWSVFKRTILFPVICLLLCLSINRPPDLLAQTVHKARKVVVMVDPVYPSVLQSGHFVGQIRLAATVLPNGNVSAVEVKGGNPMFSQYASQAISHWKYEPGPTQTVEEVKVNFGLTPHQLSDR